MGCSYALLIFRQEEIIGLVNPLLPKPSMKPCFILIMIIPLVCLRITCVYSSNAIIVLFKCVATLVVQTAHTEKCINLSIASYLCCTLYIILMTTNIIWLKYWNDMPGNCNYMQFVLDTINAMTNINRLCIFSRSPVEIFRDI